jgi:hypothetical protein
MLTTEGETGESNARAVSSKTPGTLQSSVQDFMTRRFARIFQIVFGSLFILSAMVFAQSSGGGSTRPRVVNGDASAAKSNADKKPNASVSNTPTAQTPAKNQTAKPAIEKNGAAKSSPTPVVSAPARSVTAPNALSSAPSSSPMNAASQTNGAAANGAAMSGAPSTIVSAPPAFTPPLPAKGLPANVVRARISEAQRLLATRPNPVIATVTPTPMPAHAPTTVPVAKIEEVLTGESAAETNANAMNAATPKGAASNSAANSAASNQSNGANSANNATGAAQLNGAGGASNSTSFLRPTYFVTLAAIDPEAKNPKVHLITLPKDTFLTRGASLTVPTSLGTIVRVQILRANGVNTAVVVSDLQGHQLTPLVVQYPIERGGGFREMAYYTSAHPALLSPELINTGQNYVYTMLDFASKQLRTKGIFISPQVVDIAERLCVVEHIDHDRFRREDRRALFEEVYALYALNDQNTYRYSVSVAGAGGMVQMIPSTYQMLRRLHPNVGLNPDFVAGMRNHGNALQAMLLYMQDTWNSLITNDEIMSAVSTGLATQAELLAAGYNSNPAHLARALKRGVEWRNYVPRETQMYLQIYRNLEALMTFKSHAAN